MPKAALATEADPLRQGLAHFYAREVGRSLTGPFMVICAVYGAMFIPGVVSTLRDQVAGIWNDQGFIVGVCALLAGGALLLATTLMSYVTGYKLPNKYG